MKFKLILPAFAMLAAVAPATTYAADENDAPLSRTDGSEWVMIFNDEFDSGSMDTEKWAYHPRYSSTWNKRIAKSAAGREAVNKFTDGVYNAYAIPTPEDAMTGEGSIPMITGAIYTGSNFYCTGGYIEARIKTSPHLGNFPAFWMMPSKSPNGWPKDGEIDIWEQIDLENVAYHTVHTAWRYKSLGPISKNSDPFGGTCTVDMKEYHVYGLEWDQDALKWYVDGKLRFTYKNQHYTEGKYTEHFTWPYHAPFYIILNQSVGDGSWAKPADTAHTYLTQFDYVRVYQKKDSLDYFSKADGYVTTTIDEVTLDGSDNFDPNAPREYFNMQGIRVDASNLTPGIYIVKQSNRTWKELVK